MTAVGMPVKAAFVSFCVFLCGLSCIDGAGYSCHAHDFGQDSVVCVCDATYCDTVEPNGKLPRGKSAMYSTSRDGLRLQKQVLDFQPTVNATGEPVFTIERNTSYQNIFGFGGAFTDAAVLNIATLSEASQEKLLQSYYSPSGVEYSLGRIPMASCDFSTHQYSYADTPGDFELKNFSLAEEDLQYKIPAIKKAMQMSSRNISLFGSPWSCPYWMKTNQNMTGKGSLIGQPGGKYYKTWALYFARFIEEYARHNISLWGLTAENEPTQGLIDNYPFQALGFTAEMQRDFIAMDLGPTLKRRGHGHIKLMVMDDQRVFLPGWADVVLKSEAAAQYVSGVAVHWYADPFVPPLPLANTHKQFPEVFLLYTEACAFVVDKDPTTNLALGRWSDFEDYAHNIIQDLQNWVVGWTDWNIALSMQGGPSWMGNKVQSPIIINKDKDEFYKQPTFYALGHFSKFLPPGTVRVKLGQHGGSSTLLTDAVAFKTPDGATVLIISNREDTSQPLHIDDSEAGGVLNIMLPPRSLHTLIWWT